MDKGQEKLLIVTASCVGVLMLCGFLFKDKIAAWLSPVAGRISSKFGYRTDPVTLKAGSFHNGIDIASPNGTPVKAPSDAVVDSVWTDATNGNAVRLKHKNGYTTGYAHLSKQLVKKGDSVKAGQAIGNIGSTGKSTGNHLHFVVKNEKGAYIDPMKYIQGIV